MMNSSFFHSVIVATMLAALMPMPLAAQDTCATAVVVTEDGSIPFDSTGASSDEPCAPGYPTVWFRFVAPEDGTVVADLCGSSFDTYLTVFAGANCPVTCTGLVAENDDFCDLQSGVTFSVVQGQSYHFAINGFLQDDFGPGFFNFNFLPQSDEPGDTCLTAVEIVDNGNYEFDTTERSLDEPCFLGQPARTFWFRYVVATAGVVYASTCPGGAASFDSTLIAHITDGACPVDCSTAVDGQDLCGFSPGEYGVRFFVEAGDTVFLTVSGYEANDAGAGTLSFEFTPITAGDTCEEAGEIVANGAHDFETTGATADDPCREGISNVWYRYTAEKPGFVMVDLCGTSFEAHLNVYADGACPVNCGELLMGDTMVCDGASASLDFEVSVGTTYYFSVSGETDEDFGEGVLNFEFTPANAGDTCAEATEVTENGIYSFSNIGASTDDPCPGRLQSPTVWYSFTAPANGELLVETCGLATFDTFISAFQGDCPVACEDRVAFNDDGEDGCGLRSRMVFPVAAGLTYKIALSGFGTAQGEGEVLIVFTGGDVILGDINGDGVVNVADVTELANLIVAGNAPDVSVGDVNEDGVVDELDVHALAEVVAGN